MRGNPEPDDFSFAHARDHSRSKRLHQRNLGWIFSADGRDQFLDAILSRWERPFNSYSNMLDQRNHWMLFSADGRDHLILTPI
jgi:hypothetical protein